MKQSYVVDFSQFLNTSRTGEHPVHAVRLARPRPSNSKPNQTCVKYKSLYRSLDLNSIIVLVSTMHLQTRNLGFLTVHQFWLTVFAPPPPRLFLVISSRSQCHRSRYGNVHLGDARTLLGQLTVGARCLGSGKSNKSRSFFMFFLIYPKHPQNIE